MNHKSYNNPGIKVNIYIINVEQSFFIATSKFINNFRTIDTNIYEIIPINELSSGLIEKLRMWDVLIIDSEAVNSWENIELIYNVTENIILFSENDNIDINLKIFLNNMNILILPRNKSLEDIKIYEEYLYTVISRSTLVFNDVGYVREPIISFQVSNHNTLSLVAADKSTIDSIEKLKKIAKVPENVNILLVGPTGTGKNIFAKYFHYQRIQNKGVNITYTHIDVSEFSPNLINSELFGYEKGSFTGATQNKIGRIENAQKGILHIDELGNSTEFQTILLKLIEQRKYICVGGTEEKDFNGDIIASTNIDIKDNKVFRQDLRERFTYKIIIPPLKDRPKDLIRFIDLFEERLLKSINKYLSSKAKYFLKNKEWPRNIRQLESLFQNCVLLDNSEITEEDVKNIYSE